MYGLANQGIKDLVTQKFGNEAWDAICKDAKIDKTDFVSLQMYPDEMTYAIVGAATRILNMPATDVLRAFGQHWITYTAKEGFGPIVDLFGATFVDCLKNLNALHARMGMTLPGLNPPNFIFQEAEEDSYVVEYQSKRPGLCPMVEGLLQGLASKYGLTIQIESVNLDGRNLFQIKVCSKKAAA